MGIAIDNRIARWTRADWEGMINVAIDGADAHLTLASAASHNDYVFLREEMLNRKSTIEQIIVDRGLVVVHQGEADN